MTFMDEIYVRQLEDEVTRCRQALRGLLPFFEGFDKGEDGMEEFSLALAFAELVMDGDDDEF